MKRFENFQFIFFILLSDSLKSNKKQVITYMHTRKYFVMILLRFQWLMIFFFCGSAIFAQASLKDISKNSDYKNASTWLHAHPEIYDSLQAYSVPANEAIAIVFPELMRYSAMEDKMEVTGLMVLYTRLGKDYANFSVGHFQMKPSFIEQLESDARIYLSPDEVQRICPFLGKGEDTRLAREARVGSLTSIKDEVSYLALFYKICLARFKQIPFHNSEERIQFLATAYNCGYHHSAQNLFAQMKKQQFPVYEGIFIKHVNYSNLALAWWKHDKGAVALSGKRKPFN